MPDRPNSMEREGYDTNTSKRAEKCLSFRITPAFKNCVIDGARRPRTAADTVLLDRTIAIRWPKTRLNPLGECGPLLILGRAQVGPCWAARAYCLFFLVFP